MSRDPVAWNAVLSTSVAVVLFGVGLVATGTPRAPSMPADPVDACLAWARALPPAGHSDVYPDDSPVPSAPDVVLPVADGRYEVPRELLGALVLEDLHHRRTRFRAVPDDRGGGLRITRVHPDGLWAAMDFRRGDVVVGTNHFPARTEVDRILSVDALLASDPPGLAVERRRGTSLDVVCLGVR